MDNFVYQSFDKYFQTLGKTGYLSSNNTFKLIVLNFIFELIYKDYRGYVSKEDYLALDRALNCLYGTTCLIPYPDYLKMGKLHLGEMAEVLDRTKAVEDYSKDLDKRILDNDALIADNIRRIDEHGTRLDNNDSHTAEQDELLAQHTAHLTSHDETLQAHNDRLVAVEGTKVVKGKNHIVDIPDIDLSGYDEVND